MSGGTYQVLVVEDEPVIQELVASMLEGEMAGHPIEVVVVSSGAEAVTRARQMRPHVVLLDIVLPDLDGIAVCRLIKADPRLEHTRVCMLTAKAGARDHEAARAAGADAYVEKPFKGLELMELVQRLLEGQSP
jgi:CheY-like chemotaxis protein